MIVKMSMGGVRLVLETSPQKPCWRRPAMSMKRMGGSSGRLGGIVSGAARRRRASADARPVTILDVAPPATGSSAEGTADRLARVERENAELRAQLRAVQNAVSQTQPSTDTGPSIDVAESPDRPTPRGRRLSEDMPPPAAVRSIRGHSATDTATLGKAVARGTVMTVRVGGNYRQGYDWDDICALGTRILNKELTLGYIKHHQQEFNVPYSTIYRWAAIDERHQKPKWLVERDMRRRTSLPQFGGVKGGGTVLGATAEKKLMVEIATAAKAHCPYRYDEVVYLVRKTAVDLGLKIGKTGMPYTMTTDVSRLVASFIQRCAQQKVHILEKRGRTLGEEAAAKRQSTERDFWEKNRSAVRSAESLLAEARDGLESLRVAQLRSIILSRTGRLSKSKNNKDGEVLEEARKAVREQPASLIPPTPERPVVGRPVSESDAARAAMSTTRRVNCPSCEKMVTLPRPDDDGNFWCAECDGALSDAEGSGSDDADGADDMEL